MELHAVSGRTLRQFALPSWMVWSLLVLAISASFYGGVLLTSIRNEAQHSRQSLDTLAVDMKESRRESTEAKIMAAKALEASSEAIRIVAENQRETALIKAWAQGTVGKPLNPAEGR